jgi:hypothetical protein
MGDHYAPRKYLLGFCDPKEPGRIWVYDRVAKRRFRTTVGNVAHENNYYDPEDEKALNEWVEMPANPIIGRLREGGGIAGEDREKLAVYIATFICRVPYRRTLAKAVAPEAIQETIRETREQILTQGEQLGLSSDLIERKLAEVDSFAEKYKSDYPPEVWEQIRNPWPTEKIVQAVYRMTWRVLASEGPSYFLSSDNPVFFFNGIGLGNSDSEFSFPLSSRLLLLGNLWRGRQTSPMVIDQHYVKEFNRRTASKSTRFLFYHEWQDWIAALGDKQEQHHRLNRLVWNG